MITTEEEVMNLLAPFKWEERYMCHKCGHRTFKKGRKPHSRKCSSCDYDESLLKFTAFEGLHLPIEKAYAILSYICEYSYLKTEEEIPTVRKKDSNPEDEFTAYGKDDDGWRIETLSAFLERRMAVEGYDPRALDEQLSRIMARWKPTVAKLAAEFEVEENTIMKLVSRVNNRILGDYGEDAGPSLDALVEFLNYAGGTQKKLYRLLARAMAPLAGDWKYGQICIDSSWFFCLENPGEMVEQTGQSPCRIYYVKFKEEWRERSHFHDRYDKKLVEYTTPLWYKLFSANGVELREKGMMPAW